MITTKQHTKSFSFDRLIRQFATHGKYGLKRSKDKSSFDLFDQDQWMMRITINQVATRSLVRISGLILPSIDVKNRYFVDAMISDFGAFISSKEYLLEVQGSHLVLTKVIASQRGDKGNDWIRILSEIHNVSKSATELRDPLAENLRWHLDVKLN